jgi:hypothetical protein
VRLQPRRSPSDLSGHGDADSSLPKPAGARRLGAGRNGAISFSWSAPSNPCTNESDAGRVKPAEAFDQPLRHPLLALARFADHRALSSFIQISASISRNRIS